MSEAVAPVNEFAFTKLSFEKLLFANAVGNKGSSRIKEKTGGRLIAIEPSSFVDPQFTHNEVWELTKEMWAKSMDTSN